MFGALPMATVNKPRVTQILIKGSEDFVFIAQVSVGQEN